MKCDKCGKEYYGVTSQTICSDCLRSELKLRKIKASSGGPASFVYRTCEIITFFCDDYSKIRVVQEGPWTRKWTIDEFIEYYDSFAQNNEVDELEHYMFDVEKYDEDDNKLYEGRGEI